MPKCTLTFQLPEEREEFELATRAGALQNVLWELDQKFYRSNIKYGIQSDLLLRIRKDLSESEIAVDEELLRRIIETVLQTCREVLHEYCEENGVQAVQ